ncbi:autotransporter outer membrane beta-barrel domain-containing protein [Citrobacter werkmanii]
MLFKLNPIFIALFVSSGIASCNYAFAKTETVDAGTTVNNGTISSGNGQVVYGTTNNISVSAGGHQTVEEGGVANGTIVNGGSMYVTGEANDTIINSGNIDVNGQATNTTINGGSVAIDAGANSGGLTDPSLGGQMNNTTINAGILENRFGIDTDTTVNAGSTLQTGHAETGQASTAISQNAIINNGGTQIIDNGGTSNGSTVNSGGAMTIQYDLHQAETNSIGIQAGTANDTIVYGTLDNNGGTDNGTIVKSGGQYTATGRISVQAATSNSATIESGANATLNDNASASAWTIAGNAKLQNSTATITNSTVVAGGDLKIESGSAKGISVTHASMDNMGGLDVDTVLNAGSNYSLGGAGSGDAKSSNLTVNAGATANINSGTVTDATISGAMYVSPDASYTNTSTLEGAVSVNDGGSLTILDGANTANADVTVSNTGSVILSSAQPDNFSLGNVALNGGSIVFDDSNSAGYSSLTLATLNGAGDFYINTDLADLQDDFLTVTGQANGNYGVYVSDTGKSPASDASLQVIQTGGGTADFSLKNSGGVVDVGTYEYHLVNNGNGNWSLTPDLIPPDDGGNTPTPPDDGGNTPTPPDDGGNTPTPPDDGGNTPTPPDDGGNTPTPPDDGGSTPTPPDDGGSTPTPSARTITPSTAAVLNMAAVDPLVFQAELGSVRQRLNETRSFSHETNIWSDIYNTRNNASISSGAGFDQTLTGLTIGADKSDRSSNSVITRGAFVSYSHSDVDFDRGGNGNVDSYSFGVYASYLHNNGFYLDGILKANRFENDVNGRMTSGGAAEGYYHTNGLGAHIQGGKNFNFGNSYVAPYIAVTAFTTDSSDYTLSNGMRANVGNERSLLAEAGANIGHAFTLKNGATLQPYVGAAVTQEFIDDNNVDVNDDGHFTNDLSGTRGVYQVGLRAQLAPRLNAHISAAYAQGANVESPWIANAGISWSF